MRALRTVVCPHSMELGGSQLNAIELAAAMQQRGHEVAVYSCPGELLNRVHELGVEHIPATRSRIQPGPARSRDLLRLIHERDLDVVHGYEWPPILEGYAATMVARR